MDCKCKLYSLEISGNLNHGDVHTRTPDNIPRNVIKLPTRLCNQYVLLPE